MLNSLRANLNKFGNDFLCSNQKVSVELKAEWLIVLINKFTSSLISFLGLAAMIIIDKFEKEIIIIGLTEMRLP